MNRNLDSGIARIKEIAKDIYRSLGSGFSESVYEKAMQVGLRLERIAYESQRVVELRYRNHFVGEGYPDLVVQFGKQRVIVELKAFAGELGPPEERQVMNYMKHLKIRRGLLINFQYPPYRKEAKTKLEIKEIVL